jgi:hypothetical protein
VDVTSAAGACADGNEPPSQSAAPLPSTSRTIKTISIPMAGSSHLRRRDEGPVGEDRSITSERNDRVLSSI